MEKILFKLLTSLAYWILLFIGKTSKKIFLHYEYRRTFEEKKIPIIYAFWHNRLLYLAYLYKNKKVGVMVSQHKDGNYIAEVMKKCDLYPVRGSTTRGGIRALIEIIQYVKNGYPIAFTPDGPKGPKYTIQEGVLMAAYKTKFPIVPICWNAKRKKIFNSWDNFILPLPFNKFVIAYGKPIFVNTIKEFNKKKEELYKSMMEIVQIVDNFVF